MKLSLFSRNKLADSCDFGRRFDPEVYQRVGEIGHDFGQFQSVAFRKVVLSFVRKFVAGISAGIANLFNVVRDTSFLSEKLNLFPKHGIRFVIGDPAALGNVVGQLLQADPKQYTCAARRKGDDALRFEEFFQSFFRHVTRWSNTLWGWISNLSAFPINVLVAAKAYRNKAIALMPNERTSIDIGHVARDAKAYRFSFPTFTHLIYHNACSVSNRKNTKTSFCPAVRAYIGALHE